MSSILSGLGSAAVNTVGETVAFAGGLSGSRALDPLAVAIEQEAFKLAPIRVPEAILLAAGVAQGQVDPKQAADWATASGFNQATFDAMVNIANTGPALGSALELLRRGDWTQGQYQTALQRMGIEKQWWDGLTSLQHERLDLGAIATAVHRGIMDDAGLLVTPVPTGAGNVPRIPVSTLDTLKEFAAQGIDQERARVLVADTGLPLSLGEMLQLLNRGKVTDNDVKRSIAESNVRNEYMDVSLELARRLLTPHEYAEAELRGVLTPQEAENGAGLSGLDPADYATLFEILGRPISVKQVTTGLARGGTFGGTYSDVPAGPYRDAIRRSAVRPEYASLDYANRFSYPSGFQIKSEAPDLGEAQTEQLLLEVGWSPKWAKTFATKWAGASSGTGASDPHVAKAQTQLWNTVHTSFKNGEITEAEATAALPHAGVDPASVVGVLAVWNVERSLPRKTLTAAQIKKAYGEASKNETTGQPWTRDEALASLIALGYSAANAGSYLDI